MCYNIPTETPSMKRTLNMTINRSKSGINDAHYTPHADAIGNILRYTDTAGNVVASYTYDAFGGMVSQSGTM